MWDPHCGSSSYIFINVSCTVRVCKDWPLCLSKDFIKYFSFILIELWCACDYHIIGLQPNIGPMALRRYCKFCIKFTGMYRIWYALKQFLVQTIIYLSGKRTIIHADNCPRGQSSMRTIVQ